MALRRYPLVLKRRLGPATGWFALAAMLAATLLAFFGLLNFSGQPIRWKFLNDPYFLNILEFTVYQALLSAILSVALAWPIAWALTILKESRHKRLFLSLCVLCFVMPTLILITGLIALAGPAGLLTRILAGDWNIYGLSGILIAHIYLNLPFATRSIYQRLQSISIHRWRLADQLRLTRWQIWRLIYWPAGRTATWLSLGFITVLCFNSFAVVLALGGGPKQVTFEVAIYQALKYEFNIPEALVLAWVQLFIAGSLYLLVTTFGQVSWLGREQVGNQVRLLASRPVTTVAAALYAAAWLFLLSPILALLPRLMEVPGPDFWARLWRPAFFSLSLAFGGTILAVGLAYAVLKPYRQALRTRSTSYIWIDGLASHALVVPGMVLSVGLFVFLIHRVSLDIWAFWLVMAVNALISVPFAITQLKPALVSYDQQYGRLRDNLKLGLWQSLQLEWRFIRPVLNTAAAFVFVLVLGDVAIYSIFGTQKFITLPWLIYGYASAYQITEAALVSVILLVLCAAVVYLLERNRHHASA